MTHPFAPCGAKRGLTQTQAAKLLGSTPPRVSDLMRGKISLFGLDALVNMATASTIGRESALKCVNKGIRFFRKIDTAPTVSRLYSALGEILRSESTVMLVEEP